MIEPKNKHTLGPWKAELELSNRGGWSANTVQWFTVSSGDKIIAQWDTEAGEYPDDPDENASNALLMGAAPEMAMALRDFIAWVDRLPGHRSAVDIQSDVRAVLRKAGVPLP